MTFYRKHDSYLAEAQPQHPYSYRHGMPLHNGYYIALEYIPERYLPGMLEKWREWCKSHPRSEWPRHVLDYAEKMKREGQRTEIEVTE